MMRDEFYPKSFPNDQEEQFLDLLLCPKDEILLNYAVWKSSVMFDEIDHATLRLLPLLYLRLKEFPIEDDLIGRIKGTYRLAWYKNQQLLETTKQIAHLLSEKGIPIMVMKGIPLLLTAYKNPGARFLSDVDLLVHTDHATQAIEQIMQAGWNPKERFFETVKPVSEKILHKYFNEITFNNPQFIELDLHWQLFEPVAGLPHPMSSERVWEHAIPLSVLDSACFMPCPEDLLIHVMIHGSAHNSHRTLRWVVDAMSILSSATIDWDLLLEKTRTYDCSIEIRTAFAYLTNRFHLVVPESFEKNLSLFIFDKIKQNAYLKSANEAYFSPLGNLPMLTQIYFSDSALRKKSFLDFICEQKEISRKRDLPVFVLNKYIRRFRSK